LTTSWSWCEQHLYRAIREDVEYFNRAQPHQGIEQKIPEEITLIPERQEKAKIIAFQVLNGLHHDYRIAAWATKGHILYFLLGFLLTQQVMLVARFPVRMASS